MAEQQIETFFAETISNVSHSNGVFRITFAQQETEDSVAPQVKLLVPANQLPRLLQSISDAATEIGRRVREANEQAKEQNGEQDQSDDESDADSKTASKRKTKKP